MRLLIKATALIVAAALSLAAFAEDFNCPTGDTPENQIQISQRGCCSWHGGNCGCQYGRIVCCDGQYSPSCTCNTDDQKTFKPVDEDEKA